MNKLLEILKDYGAKLKAGFVRFDGCHPVCRTEMELDPASDRRQIVRTERGVWDIVLRVTEVENRPGAVDIRIRYSLMEGEAVGTNVGFHVEFSGWSRDNYVLMPSAVYDGNRFEARNMSYPPMFRDSSDLRPDMPTIITDVPRLAIGDGISRVQQITRDLATPAIGFQSADGGKGFWLLTEQGTALGDSSLEIEENEGRSHAVISVTAPGVRYHSRYTICDMDHDCEDRGVDFKTGDSVDIHVRLYFFPCPEIQGLFDAFTEIRKDLSGDVELQHEIPFSSAWEIQEEKYNRQNWEEKRGYYSVGMRDGPHQDWQIGWVGGLMSTYPLLYAGQPRSKERALRTLDFAFREGQDTSGLFHGCAYQGKFFGDCFYDFEKRWHLIRKSSDALYFILKHFLLLQDREPDSKLPEIWLEGTRRCADAFVRLWKRYGQFGQFVDSRTGDIIVGGSVSAGIAPAGLALAARFFGQPEYLAVAEAAAAAYYEKYVKKGITTGGPGEILQCPDSESAFGLLESFVILYEETGRNLWLEAARDLANQCFTWCVSYDFKFPSQSTFGRLGIRTAGSVYANVQNKHSAPGICTLSGDTLFKLYRATGDGKYLELIQEIAHNLPQYLSREDKPIMASDGRCMPAGWMNERVEMSDWLEPVGEIFYGSCWCEVSNMLTYVEIPGLYVQTDTGLVCAIDHIDVKVMENTSERIELLLTNPTKFPARVRVFTEKSTDMRNHLKQHTLLNRPVVEITPKETGKLVLEKE